MKFKDVMNLAFLEYERQIVKGKSTGSAFAEWLGKPQSTVSQLMNGRDPGKHKADLARKLAELNVVDEEGHVLVDFRSLVYESVGEDEPMPDDPLLREALRKFRKLTPAQRKHALTLLERMSSENRQQITNSPLQLA